MKSSMKNKIKYLILISIILMIAIFSFSTKSIATGDPFQSELKNLDNEQGDADTTKKVDNVVQSLVVITQIVGVGVAFIILAVLAMKYMTAAPGDKADIKKSAFIYLLGALIVFGVPQILKILVSLGGVFNS